MQSFIVFASDGVDAMHFPPRHAFLVGNDEVPMQSNIAMRPGSGSQPGTVWCEKPQAQSSGLAVQVVVPRPALPPDILKLLPDRKGDLLGLLTLHTCLLPDRDQPYLLMIELARRQIMLLLNKLEDWQLTDLSTDHPIMRQFELARDRFTEALVVSRGVASFGVSEEPPANRLAREALGLALEAGEELAVIQAQRQLRSRLSGQAYKAAGAHAARLNIDLPAQGAPITIPGAGHVVLGTPPVLGCAISPAATNEAVQRAALAACDFVTMPMRWIDLEPKEGKYSFAATDKWIEWAVRTAKLPIVGGPLIDFRPGSTPEWLFIWENDYETLRDMVFEHVQAVVTRYRKTVSRWTVASGLHVNTNFKISFEQIMDLTRLCVLLVKKLHPAAKIQLELSQPWAEYHTTNKRSIPPYLYAEAALTAGLPIDTIGVRVQMGHAEPGLSTRDMLSVSAMLDRFAALEKPVAVTALGAPGRPITPKPYVPRAGAEAEAPYEPGFWREPWNEATQAGWAAQLLAVCCSKPYVQSVCWQELADPADPDLAAEMPFGGLTHADGKPKAVLTDFVRFRAMLREQRAAPGG
jgi:hypothetical protein